MASKVGSIGRTGPAVITPGLEIRDPLTAYWFAQVTLRLRREIAWCWYLRTGHAQPDTGILPPLADAAAESLDLIRYERDKQLFIQADPAARFLTQQLKLLQRPEETSGHWRWVRERLQLSEASEFVLALALAARADAGLAPVFAVCLNDMSRPFPTLALAQRLWERPAEIIACADPDHFLFQYGLLGAIHEGGNGPVWQRALDMPAVLAQQLIDDQSPLPQAVTVPEKPAVPRSLDVGGELLLARLNAQAGRMQVVPLVGDRGVSYADWAQAMAKELGRPLAVLSNRLQPDSQQLRPVACVCWLKGLDVLLPEHWLMQHDEKALSDVLMPLQALPVRWYLPLHEHRQRQVFPVHVLTPPLRIDSLDFEQRVAEFTRQLGAAATDMQPVIEECARRFRFQEQKIGRVAQTFADGATPLTVENLLIACANEAFIDMDNLAQAVKPRFDISELVLPAEQLRQFEDILHAMKTLTVVHYHWGTARAWNESGLAVLFCGSPGTGKTMAAEALGAALNLPMYRIDLSQVVNKYIGETEKNLRHIFDAAEVSDCILFFDEADALFGKRTDVKDAHDRFANIEISYLLERMERFKGLAILATNRRKDLDEAFMRRLRYVIEFPAPAYAERRRIWQQVFPAGVDIGDLDLHYLAKQFALSGGHIRSIALNACLRAAGEKTIATPKVAMPDVLMAVKRELEKMDRSSSAEVFGSYGHLLENCA